MADFKVVISDPEAVNQKRIKVKVKTSDTIDASQEELEGRKLGISKINQKMKENLELKEFLTIVQIKEGDKKEKNSLHFRVEVDNSVPEDVIMIPKKFGEKLGGDEVEVTAFRTPAFQLLLDQNRAMFMVGKRIDDEIDGADLGLPELKLKISGGSDSSGFPMRYDIQGAVKKRVLVSGPPGYYPKNRGERRRKVLRGNTISQEIVQINTIILRQ